MTKQNPNSCLLNLKDYMWLWSRDPMFNFSTITVFNIFIAFAIAKHNYNTVRKQQNIYIALNIHLIH